MFSPQHHALLEKLKKCLEAGDLTPTDRVGFGTFVCITHMTPFGMAYTQCQFEELPFELAAALNGKAKGDKIGPIKIVAVFDTWPEMDAKQAPTGQVFDN